MKLIKMALLALSISVVGCQSSNRKQAVQNDSLTHVSTVVGQITDERFLVVAGRSVGEIAIGADMEQVGQKLGKADAGDAAMGKAWGIWYGNDSTGRQRNEIAVYSSYRDTSMRVKDVKQIRVTSDKFKIVDSFSLGTTLTALQSKFPDLKQVSRYVNAQKDTVLVYDSKKRGISFEFLKGKSIALTVHPENVAVNATYLTLHPEWKIVE
ncbi:hypothetical protein DBR40_10240 [Pedobacter sp. KBW01]|uniref:hypothetical protein n=1 Tax=Pedobacter sp. KBW01 TaxID=2153364 RepID=UPI000F5AEE8C|nr:hypothetical protein [Pedobacter sp. KBW01]RQO77041.1 hypothetical protein DBR40_10240 [Pedobacter sp. KBW01]